MDDILLYTTVQIYTAMLNSHAYDHTDEYELMNMAIRQAHVLLAKLESEGEELS